MLTEYLHCFDSFCPFACRRFFFFLLLLWVVRLIRPLLFSESGFIWHLHLRAKAPPEDDSWTDMKTLKYDEMNLMEPQEEVAGSTEERKEVIKHRDKKVIEAVNDSRMSTYHFLMATAKRGHGEDDKQPASCALTASNVYRSRQWWEGTDADSSQCFHFRRLLILLPTTHVSLIAGIVQHDLSPMSTFFGTQPIVARLHQKEEHIGCCCYTERGHSSSSSKYRSTF